MRLLLALWFGLTLSSFGASPEEQASWHRLASTNSDAQFQLAIRYRDGRGVEPSHDAWLYWLQRAAHMGHRAANHELARAWEGRGLPRDMSRARDGYARAYNQQEVARVTQAAKYHTTLWENQPGATEKLLWIVQILAAYLLLTGAGWLFHRAGLTYGTGQAVSYLGMPLAFFCLEHWWGLGTLTPLGVISGLATLGWAGWWLRQRPLPDQCVWVEGMKLLFLLAFTSWRWLHPSLELWWDPISNQRFVNDFMQGQTLPAWSTWLAGMKADHYYNYHLYCSALLGRLTGMSPGLAHAAGWILHWTQIGLVVALLARFIPGRGWQAAFIGALLLANQGSAALVTWVSPNRNQNIGKTAWADLQRNPKTEWLAPTRDFNRAFNWGHIFVHNMPDAIICRDHQSNVVGAYLGWLALLLLLQLHDRSKGGTGHAALFALAGTLPLAASTNLWIAPFQTALVLTGCWLWHQRQPRPPNPQVTGWLQHLPWPAIGGAVGLGLLLLPHYSYTLFTAANSGGGMFLTDEHGRTPIHWWVVMFGPVLGMGLLAAPFGNWGRTVTAAVVLMLGLGLVECVWFDDYHFHNTFNIHLKWWAYVYPVGAAWLWLEIFRNPVWPIKALATALMLWLSSYSFMQFRTPAEPIKGALDGNTHRLFKFDRRMRLAIQEELRRPTDPAYHRGNGFRPAWVATDSAPLTLLGAPTYVGPHLHTGIYLGDWWQVDRRNDQVRRLYTGASALDWLDDVGYVLWEEWYNWQHEPGRWAFLDARLRSLPRPFEWVEQGDNPSAHHGYWRRAAATQPSQPSQPSQPLPLAAGRLAVGSPAVGSYLFGGHQSRWLLPVPPAYTLTWEITLLPSANLQRTLLASSWQAEYIDALRLNLQPIGTNTQFELRLALEAGRIRQSDPIRVTAGQRLQLQVARTPTEITLTAIVQGATHRRSLPLPIDLFQPGWIALGGNPQGWNTESAAFILHSPPNLTAPKD